MSNDQQSPFDLKRLALFFLLSMAVFYAWALVSPPQQPPPATPTEATTMPPPLAPGGPEAAPAVAAPTVVLPVGEAAPRRVRIETPHWDVDVSNVGGRIASWQLREHKEYGDASRPVDVVRRRRDPAAPKDAKQPESASDSQDVLPLQIRTGDPVVDRTLASAIHRIDVRDEPGRHVVDLSWSDGVVDVRKTVTFNDEPPITTIEAKLTVGGQPRAFRLLWGPGFGNHTEGERQNTYFRRGLVAWRSGGKVRIADRPAKADELGQAPVDWVAIEDSFFTALFVPAQPTVMAPSPTAAGSAATGQVVSGELRADEKGKTHKSDWPDELVLEVPFTPTENVQSLYVGARERTVLEGLAPAFPGDRAFPSLLQMGILQPIAVAMHHVLIWLHGRTASWGAAIVLLTLIIRALLFPLTHVSLKRMRVLQEKLKVVKPREKVIIDRFRKLPRTADNRLREQQERTALYAEAGIGPAQMMTGCLPVLLSMPFFFALFRLLPNAPEFRHEPFLRVWSDLSTADPYHVWPIATAVTMFVSSWMSMSQAPAGDPMQRNMLLFLPLMFLWFCWGAPLGLVVYWTISNVVQLGQQQLLNVLVPATQANAPPASSKRTGKKKN